jgi:hypothetical protein
MDIGFRCSLLLLQCGDRLIYTLCQIAKIIELADMQPRLEAIERAIGSRTPCK